MNILKKLSVFLIEKYQKYLSPILKHHNIKCKYYPTCSEYTKQSIIKYGFFKGGFLGLIRIIKCNPFSKGGYDPVK